jgi:hypothetical protein
MLVDGEHRRNRELERNRSSRRRSVRARDCGSDAGLSLTLLCAPISGVWARALPGPDSFPGIPVHTTKPNIYVKSFITMSVSTQSALQDITPAFAIAFIMSITFLGYQVFRAPIIPMWATVGTQWAWSDISWEYSHGWTPGTGRAAPSEVE